MSGSGAIKRSHALALRCAKLASQGWTYHNIAETVDKRPEQIKALVFLGERLKENER